MKVKIYPLYVSFCDGDFLGKVQKVFKKAFLSFWELDAMVLSTV